MNRSMLPATLVLVCSLAALLAAGPMGQAREAAKDTREAVEVQQSDRAGHTVREHGDTEANQRMNDGKKPMEGQENKEAVCPMCGMAMSGDMEHKMLVQTAKAVMMPTEDNSVNGTITFEQTKDGVKVRADIAGLKPNSKHGFHVHEFGDLSSPDGTAMGGHYNPDGHDHALPDADSPRHAGDFGNLEADDQGNATMTETFTNISLAGMTNPILGRGMIIHAQPDDGGQPTGNAGARIAQGVIGVAK